MPTKFRIVTKMFLSIILYCCESEILKKIEGNKTDAFELWRSVRVSSTAKRTSQSVLKQIKTDCFLRAMISKQTLTNGHVTQINDGLEKMTTLGKVKKVEL